MGMFLAREDGLWTFDGGWARLSCPLTALTHAALADGHVAAVSNGAHQLLLDGTLLPCDRDVESLHLWRGHALTLSSDTDCVSIADRDGWLVTVRTGMYPQDMCLLDDTLLVCGGADGLVHRLTLPDLRGSGTYAVPGMAMRIHAVGDTAHILCTAEEDGLYTQLCRFRLSDGLCTPCACYPGLPGAVRADGSGGLWVAVSEALHHIPEDGAEPDLTLDGFGLIRHIDVREGIALVTDPVLPIAAEVTPDGEITVLDRGNAGQAGYC